MALFEAIARMLPGDPARRRRHRMLRRRIEEAKSNENGAELVRIYEQLEIEEVHRFGIDALRALISVDPFAARPLLRQVIQGSGDVWLTTFALERVEEYGVVELRDVVRMGRA